MNELERLQREIETLKAEQAAKAERQAKLQAAKDSKEKAEMISKMELAKLYEATLRYQIATGEVSPAVARNVIKAAKDPKQTAMDILADLIDHPVSGVSFGLSGKLTYQGTEYQSSKHLEQSLGEMVGFQLPQGWLSRYHYTFKTGSSDSPAINRRLAKEAAMAQMPEVSPEISWADRASYMSAIGQDPLA